MSYVYKLQDYEIFGQRSTVNGQMTTECRGKPACLPECRGDLYGRPKTTTAHTYRATARVAPTKKYPNQDFNKIFRIAKIFNPANLVNLAKITAQTSSKLN